MTEPIDAGERTVAETPAAKGDTVEQTAEGGSFEQTAATIASVGGTSTSASVPSTRGTPAPAVEASFHEALRAAEIARTRRFVPITSGMALAIAALLPWVDGHPVAKNALYIAVLVGIAALGYLYTLTQTPARYTEGRVGATYVVCLTAIYAGVYFFGVFSSAGAVVTLGIFFLGIGRSDTVGLVLYLSAALLQATLAGLIIIDVVPDYGIVRADDVPIVQRVITQGALQIVFLVTYLVARATRAQLDVAVADHDQAVHAVAKRDALLQEARQELDRALQVGGPGRYTEQELGSFSLGNVLGRGAMGEVYEAVHRETGEPAAVKLLSMGSLAQPGQLTRFLREARAAASLDSPNVVRILEVSDADSPLPFIAMERLRGDDLGHLLRQKRSLSADEIVGMVTDVARGLEAARGADIVHRDIKPQNLFRCEGGTWKILDFGVSKLGEHQGTLTRGSVVGTPMYMSPEQARAESVDHRADVYALATVAYRALTGRPPFSGKDLPTILHDVVYKMPQRPTEAASAPLGSDIDRALIIGLAKNPEHRFEKAADLAAALECAQGGKLSRVLRSRADKLERIHPWGQRLRG